MKNQKKIIEKISLDIEYFEAESYPELGIYNGGVCEPDLDNLSVWVNPLEEYDDKSDSFVTIGSQINLKGSSEEFFKLGQLFLAISKYKTDDPNYHVHLDNIKSVLNNKCEMIITKID